MTKISEARLRRIAARQGLRLEKTRMRYGPTIGTYQLVDMRTRDLIVGRAGSGYQHQSLGYPSRQARYYGLSLGEVEQFLSAANEGPCPQ